MTSWAPTGRRTSSTAAPARATSAPEVRSRRGPGGVRYTYRTVNPDEMSGFSDFFRAFFGDEGFSFSGATEPARPGPETLEASVPAVATSRSSTLATCSVAVPTDPAPAPRRPTGPVARRRPAGRCRGDARRGGSWRRAHGGRRWPPPPDQDSAGGARRRAHQAARRRPQAGSGSASGDLYVTVHVRPDSRFERDGANLRTEVPISLLEAIAGAEVPVHTPTGTLKLRIRPNTQNGQEIHLTGKGLPSRDATAVVAT